MSAATLKSYVFSAVINQAGDIDPYQISSDKAFDFLSNFIILVMKSESSGVKEEISVAEGN